MPSKASAFSMPLSLALLLIFLNCSLFKSRAIETLSTATSYGITNLSSSHSSWASPVLPLASILYINPTKSSAAEIIIPWFFKYLEAFLPRLIASVGEIILPAGMLPDSSNMLLNSSFSSLLYLIPRVCSNVWPGFLWSAKRLGKSSASFAPSCLSEIIAPEAFIAWALLVGCKYSSAVFHFDWSLELGITPSIYKAM